MTTLKTGISVVVPVYNSAAQIGELAVRVRNALKPYQAAFELILVNDQSADKSWSVIKELELRKRAKIAYIRITFST